MNISTTTVLLRWELTKRRAEASLINACWRCLCIQTWQLNFFSSHSLQQCSWRSIILSLTSWRNFTVSEVQWMIKTLPAEARQINNRGLQYQDQVCYCYSSGSINKVHYFTTVGKAYINYISMLNSSIPHYNLLCLTACRAVVWQQQSVFYRLVGQEVARSSCAKVASCWFQQ